MAQYSLVMRSLIFYARTTACHDCFCHHARPDSLPNCNVVIGLNIDRHRSIHIDGKNMDQEDALGQL